jgi:hypothetical protein
MTCTVVRVWEATAPDVGDRLEWILLCDADVAHFAQARECALQYATRWVIEAYHKAITTGLGAERLQLESAERLFAAIAIMGVVALRLIGPVRTKLLPAAMWLYRPRKQEVQAAISSGAPRPKSVP